MNEKNLASAAVARRIGLVRMGEILYLGSEDKIPVYGVPGLNINGGKPFTLAQKANVFGCGPPLRRTLQLMFG